MYLMRIVLASSVLVLSPGYSANSNAPVQAVPVLTRALPDLQGKEVQILTVTIPPKGASPPHRHNANTFVYVLEGTVVAGAWWH